MKRILLLLTLLPLASASSAAAQRIPRDEALRYTAHYWHGLSSIPEADRHRVLADPATIELFAQLINGDVPWPPKSDTATVLFWLGESGDRRFVPIFVRFARPPQNRRQAKMFGAAVAGLARHADVPAAAKRLRALIVDPNERDAAFQTASALATINDVAARQVLAELPAAELTVPVRELVRHALASPALPRGSRSAYPAVPQRVP